VSGHSRGTNFQAILDAVRDGVLHAEVALLVSTNAEHGAVEKARAAGVKTLIVPPADSQEAWDHRVADALYQEGVSVLVLAGYLRIVTQVLLEAFPNRILNVHPALLPSFGGKGMYGLRVHQAVLEYGCKMTGCTVHLVNERYDTGPIIAQACVAVEEDDTPETLSARVQTQEHRLYPRCIEWLIQDQLRVEGRRVKKKG
jgi:formyltetrahydrofolate-dependent phosphoribosylglycinamide formyltransferase